MFELKITSYTLNTARALFFALMIANTSVNTICSVSFSLNIAVSVPSASLSHFTSRITVLSDLTKTFTLYNIIFCVVSPNLATERG